MARANDWWYDHVAENVLENDNYKLLLDFSVQTDCEIGTRRPNLIITDNKNKRCQIIIDVAIFEDGRVREKEDEKVEEYQDLAREVGKTRGVRAKVVPVVVGELVSVPLRLSDSLRTTEVGISLEVIQRCAFLGSARILWKILEM